MSILNGILRPKAQPRPTLTQMDIEKYHIQIHKHQIQCKITDFIKCIRKLTVSYLTTLIVTCNLILSSIRKVTMPQSFSSKLQKSHHASAIYTTREVNFHTHMFEVKHYCELISKVVPYYFLHSLRKEHFLNNQQPLFHILRLFKNYFLPSLPHAQSDFYAYRYTAENLICGIVLEVRSLCLRRCQCALKINKNVL
jgi:hypothetical protein